MQVTENMLDDLEQLVPCEADERLAVRAQAQATLALARQQLARTDPGEDPLSWWPQHPRLSSIFPLAMMLFAIPATSADNERSFSSASYTLDARRYRTNIDHFRFEHRVRRFIVAGTDPHTQQGRAKRLERVRALLGRFAALVAGRGA
jgi:hypothetical protein